MKKVLENELISLAHRILKMRGKANVEELKQEAGALYEKLILLDFADKHFDGLQPTIGKEKFKQTIADEFEVERDHERYPDGTEYNPEAISEPNTEKIKDIVSQMPPESEEVDGLVQDDKSSSHATSKHDPNEMPGVSYDDLPDFEPAHQTQNDQPSKPDSDHSQPKDEDQAKEKEKKSVNSNKASSEKANKSTEVKRKSLNNSLAKDLKLGLNDRIAFTKHLFNGDQNALKTTIDQINKSPGLKEAQRYIDHNVKPHYNWDEKEDYENRLLALIENKFSE